MEFVEGLERRMGLELELNVVVYNCLINGYVEKGDKEGVNKVLN